MIVAGCDVGSLTAKAVIMKENALVSHAVIEVLPSPEASGLKVMAMATEKAHISPDDINWCVATGYGRKHLPFADSVESEIACHGRGAVWHAPSVRTIIDIGGQDAKAIKIDDQGNVLRYQYNDKCASGTGRFLQIIAEALEVNLEDLGGLAEKSTQKLSLSNQCVVFAETEIISLVNEGKEIPDIINALHQAVANRAASMAKGIVVAPEVTMTGGVAQNSGMFAALSRALEVELIPIEYPQINGAIGAALFAQAALEKNGSGQEAANQG